MNELFFISQERKGMEVILLFMISTIGLFILLFISFFIIFGLNLEKHYALLGIMTSLIVLYLITILIIVIASGNIGSFNAGYWILYILDICLYGLAEYVYIVEVSSDEEEEPRTKEFYEIDKKSIGNKSDVKPVDLKERKER